MHSLILSLYHFNVYLKGGSPADLQQHMNYYDKALVQLNRDFHLLTIDANDDIIKGIKAILRNLNIPEYQWERYIGSHLTIYDFFVELKKENHPQIDFILEIIDAKKELGQFELLFGMLLVALFVTGIFCIPALYGIAEAISNFLISVIGLPILGLVFTNSLAAFSIYQNTVDKKKTTLNRFRDNFFVITNTVVNIVAYGIWIATASAMTPVVASLFVAASILEVIKEVVSFAQDYSYYIKRPPIEESDNLTDKRAYVRHEFGFKKHRNAAMINLATAIVLVGIMAVWCFMPPSIVITLCAVTAIFAVYVIKYKLLKYNAAVIRDNLQYELKQIEITYENEHHLSVALSSNSYSQNITNNHTQNIVPKLNLATNVGENAVHDPAITPSFYQRERSKPIAASLPFYHQKKSPSQQTEQETIPDVSVPSEQPSSNAM